jgi:SAM-dependent methyltransferase
MPKSEIEDWQEYNRWNRRHEAMAELWVRDLIRYLTDLPWLNSHHRILDYGCGYFDLGMALAPRVGRIDGYDPHPPTLALAKSRASVLPNVSLHETLNAIPQGTYDLIVVNSVLQYLPSDEAILELFRQFKTWLREGGPQKVLLCDLIPQDYSAPRDALRSLQVAVQNRLLGPMFVHLWKSARKGKQLQLYKLAPERTEELAREAGFHCERLPGNLTPSRQRYTCLLRAT